MNDLINQIEWQMDKNNLFLQLLYFNYSSFDQIVFIYFFVKINIEIGYFEDILKLIKEN